MKDIKSLTFEDALKELENLVRRLEEGKVDLEEAISTYERGTLLKSHCEQKLRDARMRVEKMMVEDPNGPESTTLFQSE